MSEKTNTHQKRPTKETHVLSQHMCRTTGRYAEHVKRDQHTSKETAKETNKRNPRAIATHASYLTCVKHVTCVEHVKRDLRRSKETHTYHYAEHANKETHISKETSTRGTRAIATYLLYLTCVEHVKRDLRRSKETYTDQKRPTHIKKETYVHQGRPTHITKRNPRNVVVCLSYLRIGRGCVGGQGDTEVGCDVVVEIY